MNQEVLNCFRDYVTLKLHFNGEIIWNPSIGSKITRGALEKRNDFAFFDRLTYEIKDREERRQYLISCFLVNSSIWIGEVLEQEIKDFHRNRMKRINSMRHTFESDIENVIDFMRERSILVRELLLTKGSRPLIIAKRGEILGGVSDETLAIIDKGFNFTSQPTDDPLWKREALQLSKYKYFLEIDRKCMIHRFDQLAQTRPHEPQCQ